MTSKNQTILLALAALTAAAIARASGDTPLHDAARAGDHAKVAALLAGGADVNTRNNREWTPLHEAADAGHRDVVQLLLDNGADARAKNDHGCVPLALYRGADTPLPNEAKLAIQQGVTAARMPDCFLAIRYFEAARSLVPNSALPLYYLGLAESKIPGRELRAICWFKAFLATAPEAGTARAVTAEIKTLEVRTRHVLLKLVEAATAAAELLPAPDARQALNPDGTRRDHDMMTISALWARAGEPDTAVQCAARIENAALRSQAEVGIAIAQALAGDLDGGRRTLAAARATAAGSERSDSRGRALSSVAGAMADLGDFADARALASNLDDAGDRCMAQAAIARAQANAGDFQGAIQTAEEIPVNFYRCSVQALIARTAAESRDRATAARMLDSARESFSGVRHDQNSVHDIGVKPVAVNGTWLGLNGRPTYPPPAPPRSAAEVNEQTFDVGDLHLDCFVAQGLTGEMDRRDAGMYLMLCHDKALTDLANARARAGDMAGADAVIDYYISGGSRRPHGINYRVVSEMNAAIASGYMRAGDDERARGRLRMAQSTIWSLREVDEQASRFIAEVANGWIAANEYLLNDPVFTSLPAHLNGLPRAQLSETLFALAGMARTLADAQCVVFALHRRPILP